MLTDILRGADVVHAAGALIVGGHTITDEEVKFGLAVTGRFNPAHSHQRGARAGDVLVLTKAIGTGILATRQSAAFDPRARGLVASMTTLNTAASRAAVATGLRCATDVTGFGLLGHALHIARATNVTLRIHVSDRSAPARHARCDRGRCAHGRRGEKRRVPGTARRLGTYDEGRACDPRGSANIGWPSRRRSGREARGIPRAGRGSVQIGDVRERAHSGEWLGLQN